MKKVRGIGIVFLMVLAVSCSKEQEVRIYSGAYSFYDSASSWTGGFADHPKDTTGYQLAVGLETLAYKVNADSSKKSLRITGVGHSDLFMYIKRKVSGLRPNTTYQILFNVKFASKASLGATNGAPGESVYVKVGGSTWEPDTVLVNGIYRMNIDKGDQAEGGENMVVIGNIGVATTTTDYAIIGRTSTSANAVTVAADARGELWLIIGTDSGFTDKTTLYYTQVEVFFNQID